MRQEKQLLILPTILHFAANHRQQHISPSATIKPLKHISLSNLYEVAQHIHLARKIASKSSINSKKGVLEFLWTKDVKEPPKATVRETLYAASKRPQAPSRIIRKNLGQPNRHVLPFRNTYSCIFAFVLPIPHD